MTHAPLRIALHGASGRMGRRIASLAEADASTCVIAAFDRKNTGNSDFTTAAEPARTAFDVLIDFSSDDGARAAVALALTTNAALLIGTTGLSEATVRAVRESSKKIPVMLAPNTSLGVAVLRHLSREASRLLPSHDLDIIEMHHSAKVDSPSGTARALAQAIEEAGRTVPADRIHAIRAGGIIGEHVVQLAGAAETIRLSHAASSRDLFAAGALHAARWLVGRGPGLYTIEHALGLLDS